VAFFVILAMGVFYVVFSLLFMRFVTGEWPDLVVPGSHGGAHESDWWQPEERRGLMERLRRLVRARTEARLPFRAGAKETGLAARPIWDVMPIPRSYDIT
jgi:hypothetical protein